ncbi:MAG: hypothetical protein ABJF10_02740 [Chthoniobacter sp.]|uniref:hypothetical protein n=1 Tax=Chthoniobacter sp. TaxID=2510640 RepID=UPI0032A2AA90
MKTKPEAPNPTASAVTAQELLTKLEALATEAYKVGEHDFAFSLAAYCGAFERGLSEQLAHAICDFFGARTKAGILAQIAEEAARSDVAKN